MSNFLAIATVTTALRDLLQAAVTGIGGTPTVTAGRPHAPAKLDPVVFLYLYSVTPNTSLRNNDLSTRRPDGRVQNRPQAAVDLRYLLSFYGDEGEQVPQQLMGKAVVALHAHPLLTRPEVQNTVAASGFLTGSNLDQATDLVRITPNPLAIEELSRLWALFPNEPYPPTLSYTAAPVLLESDELPGATLPVRDYRVYAIPLNCPQITSVESLAGPNAPILPGSTLLIKGENFTAGNVLLRISGQDFPVAGTPTRLQFDLSQVPAPRLRAGLQSIRLVQSRLMGDPPAPHPVADSNLAAMILHPLLNLPAPAAPGGPVLPYELVPGASLSLDVQPPVQAGQAAALLLAGRGAAAAGAVIDIPAQATSRATLAVPIPELPMGAYLVRMQVDGVESILDYDPALPGFSGPLALLRPQISAAPTYTAATHRLVVNLAASLAPGQQAEIRLYALPAGAQPAYRFPAAAVAGHPQQVAAQLTAVPAGTYEVRVCVDGAESLPSGRRVTV